MPDSASSYTSLIRAESLAIVSASRSNSIGNRVVTQLSGVCSEGEESAIAILYDELARLAGRVAKDSRELDATGVSDF
jgi:hypothetical protein